MSRVLLACGGTGGHLAPGLALSSVALVSPLVNALSTRGIRVAWP
jgi:UDP-N-acetylglucosamine:LPS N-acetylglucosamine transferase